MINESKEHQTSWRVLDTSQHHTRTVPIHTPASSEFTNNTLVIFNCLLPHPYKAVMTMAYHILNTYLVRWLLYNHDRYCILGCTLGCVLILCVHMHDMTFPLPSTSGHFWSNITWASVPGVAPTTMWFIMIPYVACFDDIMILPIV